MTSKLIRKFLNLIESKPKYTKFKTTSDIIFEYRNLEEPDIIIVNNGDKKLGAYLFDYRHTHQKFIWIIDKEFPLRLKDDIKTHDDMELLLKYGRYISDEYVIKTLNDTLKLNLTIDDFKEYLEYEI